MGMVYSLQMRTGVFWVAATCAWCAGFDQQVRCFYGTADGLPGEDVRFVAEAGGRVYAGTPRGLARLEGERWQVVFSGPVEALGALGGEWLAVSGGQLYRNGKPVAAVPAAHPRALAGSLLAADEGVFRLENGAFTRLGDLAGVRSVAEHAGRIAAAAAGGLYLWQGGRWQAVHPREGNRSWAPHDVRAVAFDAAGRLWFASPQGAGRLDREWRLFTGSEGLPYDDFTALAAGRTVWFGTAIGAIHYDGNVWEYRQGLRWLPHDAVRSVAVGPDGSAWFATSKGVGRIYTRPMTFQEKARFFEDEIDRRHRRTPYGYVLSVTVAKPGDASEFTQHDSDNDGLWTAMYGAGECFAWAATKDPAARRRAKAAFEALRFLWAVTQGGKPPALPGFVARTILPASGPNPNLTAYTREKDERTRATRDPYWKVLVPRWPLSGDGQWYWKADTSSDELDGHYFFHGLYYDLVADDDAERRRVREVVAAITDHLIQHDFALVDWDGTPTRWAVFGPADLNRNPRWTTERGLNSLSMLAYLKVAEHVTGEARYGEVYRRLIREHGYAANTLIPKLANGAGSGNQSDDEMAFMDYFHLLRYERDPELLALYRASLESYWINERYELNPLFAYIYSATMDNRHGPWLAESLDTLRRYPLDRFNWRLTNSHRKDVVPLPEWSRDDRNYPAGMLRNGRVLPIDERFVDHWNQDPYQLDQGGAGNVLADGASYLLPYYLGRFSGLLRP